MNFSVSLLCSFIQVPRRVVHFKALKIYEASKEIRVVSVPVSCIVKEIYHQFKFFTNFSDKSVEPEVADKTQCEGV